MTYWALPRALGFSAAELPAPKAAAPGVLWLHAATMSFDAKTTAILSFLQAQATAAPELAGDMNIDMDIVWCMAKRALLIVLL